ncbi:hypothetical protein GCM10020258_55440 [Sphingomonas yabuuchiae]
MTKGIEGKVVLITGGSTGIGAETARLLAERGAKVAIAARRKDKLDEVVAQIAENGGTARAYALDVTDKSAVQTVVAAIVADFGRLDVLINNAGLMPIRPMAEVNTDEWDQMIDVNLKGTLYGIAAALPGFLEQGSGHIINLSSVAGIKVRPGRHGLFRHQVRRQRDQRRSSPGGGREGPRHVDRARSRRERPEVRRRVRLLRRCWTSTSRPSRRHRWRVLSRSLSNNLMTSTSTRSSSGRPHSSSDFDEEAGPRLLRLMGNVAARSSVTLPNNDCRFHLRSHLCPNLPCMYH